MGLFNQLMHGDEIYKMLKRDGLNNPHFNGYAPSHPEIVQVCSEPAIGKYIIERRCYQTYPCQHYVTDTETGIRKRTLGSNIYKMLVKDGLEKTYPFFNHYKEYAEFIRRQENPTEEEIRQDQVEAEMRRIQIEKQKNEREEIERITNMYKASSRLERLREKNNIVK